MSPRRLLFVEDDKDLNLYYQTALRGEGFEVIGAFSGEEAVNLLQAESFDLVLLDIYLPDGNGVDILKKIRMELQLSQLPVCMITGYLDIEPVVDAFRHGANGYIVKPYDLDELLFKIRELLERK
jgi:DNA-binding response OmpR family regulator